MPRRITPTGLLIMLAFMVPVIVELRTVAELLGFHLSLTEYIVSSILVVLAVLVVVGLWNVRAERLNARANSPSDL